MKLICDPPRTRTENLLIKSQLLCQIELAGLDAPAEPSKHVVLNQHPELCREEATTDSSFFERLRSRQSKGRLSLSHRCGGKSVRLGIAFAVPPSVVRL